MTETSARKTRPVFDRCYRALEYGFRVRSEIPQLDGLIDGLLGPFRTARRSGLPVYSLTPSDQNGHFALHLPEGWIRHVTSAVGLLDFVLWDINREAMERTRDHLAIHAGAVAWGGRGVVLPAEPGSGKTTLAAGLTRAGFAYLSDEAAPIDLRTCVMVPYPRPLTMKPGTVAIIPGLRRRLASVLGDYDGPQYHVRPDDLRPGALGGPCRVGYVFAPTYEPGGATSLEPMTRAETLVLLAENSFNFDRHGTRGLEVLRELVLGAECYRLRMGDLESAVRAITDVVHGGEK